jgi:hypothetical protein
MDEPNTISLLALDVGFDLRDTKHPITLPALPFTCKYSRDNQRDDCAVITQRCDTPAELHRLELDLLDAGYCLSIHCADCGTGITITDAKRKGVAYWGHDGKDTPHCLDCCRKHQEDSGLMGDDPVKALRDAFGIEN